MSIYVAPLPDTFLERVRVQGVDDQGQAVRRFQSTQGGEPCRDVLRRARPGEELVLASFCPYPVPGPYREYGPVFLLAAPTGEEVMRNALPRRQGRPEDYFGAQVGVRAYNAEGDIVDGSVVEAEAADALTREYLERAEVDHVQVRLYAYGCFACRVERDNAFAEQV